MSDTPSLKFLFAAAAHERRQAAAVAAGVPAIEDKVERAKATLAATKDSLAEAVASAEAHERVAQEAEDALAAALESATPAEIADAGISDTDVTAVLAGAATGGADANR